VRDAACPLSTRGGAAHKEPAHARSTPAHAGAKCGTQVDEILAATGDKILEAVLSQQADSYDCEQRGKRESRMDRKRVEMLRHVSLDESLLRDKGDERMSPPPLVLSGHAASLTPY